MVVIKDKQKTNEHKTGWDQSFKLFIKALICTCNKWDSNL